MDRYVLVAAASRGFRPNNVLRRDTPNGGAIPGCGDVSRRATGWRLQHRAVAAEAKGSDAFEPDGVDAIGIFHRDSVFGLDRHMGSQSGGIALLHNNVIYARPIT